MDETKREREVRLEKEDRFAAWQRLLGDSRVRGLFAPRQTVASPLGEVERLYCLNCGRAGGAVTVDLQPALYICPSCAETHGGLPLPEIPETLIRA